MIFHPIAPELRPLHRDTSRHRQGHQGQKVFSHRFQIGFSMDRRRRMEPGKPPTLVHVYYGIVELKNPKNKYYDITIAFQWGDDWVAETFANPAPPVHTIAPNPPSDRHDGTRKPGAYGP